MIYLKKRIYRHKKLTLLMFWLKENGLYSTKLIKIVNYKWEKSLLIKRQLLWIIRKKTFIWIFPYLLNLWIICKFNADFSFNFKPLLYIFVERVILKIYKNISFKCHMRTNFDRKSNSDDDPNEVLSQAVHISRKVA